MEKVYHSDEQQKNWKKTNKPNSGNATILKKSELVVQRLTSDVQGKAQKYAKVGPHEFVSPTRLSQSRISKKLVTSILNQESPIMKTPPTPVMILAPGKLILSAAVQPRYINRKNETMTWTTKPIKEEFVVEEDVFGVGGFREIFKATVANSSTAEFSDTTRVIKKYLPGALTVIDITKQTVEEHTKKWFKCICWQRTWQNS
ncbi:Hypothetical predicted protein [Paramuricea clavata]|uniref:Uncharacterized protein n=1 Tax=Paramuricea clavata TaxID=317549 RepID=A0A6S7FL72_PARCT|nr:Hypothetical predicted protein [Paramuricea clavata]